MCIKISYDDCLNVKDDLELLLKKHYEHTYLTEDDKFLKVLAEEVEGSKAPIGELIASDKNNEVKYIYLYLKFRFIFTTY